MGIVLAGCGQDYQVTSSPPEGSTGSSKPADPDQHIQQLVEYRANVAERRRREAQLGDPLAEAKLAADSSQQLILRGKFQATMNFVVSLWHSDDLICSGSLVNSTTVVSAWHCLCSPLSPSVFRPPTEVRIGPLGAIPIETIPIASVSPTTCPRKINQADVAILRLKRPPSKTGPIQYPRVATKLPDDLPAVFILGYGFREDRSRNRRDMAVVTIASRDCSTKTEQSNYGCLASEFVAIDPEGQVDACNGDSGGPALIPFRMPIQVGMETDQQWLAEPRYDLIGVVSRGLTERCGSGTIYSRVGRLLD